MATASVPPGESIIVPPDQRFKEVQCHACGVTAKTETRFKGVYTCTSCQWRGLAPPKQEESVVNAVVIDEKVGKKKRSGLRESQMEETPPFPAKKEEEEYSAWRESSGEDDDYPIEDIEIDWKAIDRDRALTKSSAPPPDEDMRG